MSIWDGTVFKSRWQKKYETLAAASSMAAGKIDSLEARLKKMSQLLLEEEEHRQEVTNALNESYLVRDKLNDEIEVLNLDIAKAKEPIGRLRYRVNRGKRGDWWWQIYTPSRKLVAMCSPGARHSSEFSAHQTVMMYFPGIKELEDDDG